jgi:hypothetical protein
MIIIHPPSPAFFPILLPSDHSVHAKVLSEDFELGHLRCIYNNIGRVKIRSTTKKEYI